MRHPVGLQGLDELDVRRSEENSINAWNVFSWEGGSCSYDDEMIGDIEVPFRYKHLVKQCLPRDLPQVNNDFCVNERIYRIAPSSLHGLGLFCMDGMKVGYGRCKKSMEYVGPSYNYNDWMCLVQCT